MKTKLTALTITVLMLLFGLIIKGQNVIVTPGTDTKQNVVLEQYQLLEVRLYTEHSSAGYCWNVKCTDTTAINQFGDWTIVQDNATAGIGSGTQVVKFDGLSKGQCEIIFEYKRPWENEAPLQSFIISVATKGSYTGSEVPFKMKTKLPADSTTRSYNSKGLPSSFSWKDSGAMTAVKDQGNCGSCWAFAAAGVFEAIIKAKDGVTRDLSEQWLVNCDNNALGCSGGWCPFPMFMITGGVYETDEPYMHQDGICKSNYTYHEKAQGYKMYGSSIPSVDSLKSRIFKNGPIWVTVNAGYNAFYSYTGGVFSTDGGGAIDHAVVLCGWDDNGGNGYWILRNSWGTSWGEGGYMKIAWGTSQVGSYAASLQYNGSVSVLTASPSNNDVSSTAGTASFTVTSNTSWTAVSNQSWCTVTPSGNGNGNITATCTENTSVNSRTAIITVQGSGAGTQTVQVTQSGANPMLSVNPGNINVLKNAGSASFTVTSNTAWTSVCDQSWCIVTPSGNGNGSITATFASNTSVNSRTASITVQGLGTGTQIVQLMQSGATPMLSVNPGYMNVLDIAGATCFVVTSNISWTASSDQPWCVVTPSGNGNGIITATYTGNSIHSSRIAIITVSATGVNDQILTVTQLAAPALFTVSTDSQNVSADSGSVEFSINSNFIRIVNSDQSWCDISMDTEIGNGVITAKYAANTDFYAREAVITITSADNFTYSVTIIQEGNMTTGTKDISKEGIKVFPNPSDNGVFHVSHINAANNSVMISVKDITGKSVYNETLSNTEQADVDMQGKSKGVYIMEISTGKNIETIRLLYQ